MTSNQIQNKEVNEKIRSNRANERISREKLNEEIRNNKAMNKINVEKNDIQALYNEQLDDRERKKLLENIQLEYDKLNETAFANDLKQEIANAQRELDALIASKQQGTSLGSSSIGAIGRIIQGIAKAVLGTKGVKTSSQILNPDHMLSYDEMLTLNALIHGNLNNSQFRLLDLYPADQGLEGPSRLDGLDQAQDWGENNVPGYSGRKGHSFSNNPPVQSGITSRSTNVRRKRYYERRKDENEIPEDFSSSYGPGYSSMPVPYLTVPGGTNDNAPRSNKIETTEHGTTSGGTDYNIGSGTVSKGVIYAPVNKS